MDRSRRTTPKVRHPQGGASPDPSSSGIPAQATGHDYIVLANELFANLYNGNRNGLRFIIGHELGHIRFYHVALWYQLAVAYSQLIPLLGPTLSRLREYSCDRQGAALTPQGADRSGPAGVGSVHRERRRRQRAPWPRPAVARLLGGTHPAARSHPFTVRRLERLYGLGLFEPVVPTTVNANAVRSPKVAGA